MQTDTLTRTGPGLYTYSNGDGWFTTNVPISGSSAMIWICGNGGTYSQADQSACPISRTGQWHEHWHFDTNVPAGKPYTASGDYKGIEGDGKTIAAEGTFTAVGPIPAAAEASLAVAVSPTKPTVPVGATTSVRVEVSAHGGDVSGIKLGPGLVASSDGVVVERPKLAGFDLSNGASKTFVFSLKGAKAGKVSLVASASGIASSRSVSDSGEATLEVTGGPTLTLLHLLPYPDKLESPSNLFIGSAVVYGLDGWNTSGGPIDIYWNGKKIRSFAAPQTAPSHQEAAFTIHAWPSRGTLSNPKPCEGTLVAKQDNVTRQLELKGDAQGAVLLAERSPGDLKSGDLYCGGEFKAFPTDFQAGGGAIVYTEYPNAITGKDSGTAWFRIRIEDNEENIDAESVLVSLQNLTCIHLDGDRWLKVSFPDHKIDTSIGANPCSVRPDPPLAPGFTSVDDQI